MIVEPGDDVHRDEKCGDAEERKEASRERHSSGVIPNVLDPRWYALSSSYLREMSRASYDVLASDCLGEVEPGDM